jgi:O-antigen/teichoic acid export membrane protein
LLRRSRYTFVLSAQRDVSTDSKGSVRPVIGAFRKARLQAEGLYRSAFFLLTNWAVTSGLGFVFWIVAARLFSASDVGLTSAIVSAIGLLASLSTLGLGYTLVRRLADAPDRPRVINTSLTLVLAAALMLGIGFLAGAPLWFAQLLRVPNPIVLGGLVLIGLGVEAIAYMLNQAFIASRSTSYIPVMNTIILLVSMLSMAALARPIPMLAILLAWVVSRIIGILLGLRFLGAVISGYRPFVALDRRYLRGVRQFSLGNYAGDLAAAAGSQLLPIVIVDLTDARAAAYFYVSLTIVRALSQTSAILSMALLAEGAHDTTYARTHALYALVGALALAACGTAVLLAGGRELLTMLFGAEYGLHGQRVIQVLAFSAVPATVANMYLGVERLRQRAAGVVWVSCLLAAVSLGGTWLLVPRTGLVGASTAVVAANIVAALVAGYGLVRSWRHLAALAPQTAA